MNFKNFLNRITTNVGLARFAAFLSIINCLFFYFPFFKFSAENVDLTSFNGYVILFSLLVIVLVANFFAYYIFLFLGRIVGKILVAISFICSAIAFYFVAVFGTIIDDTMMGNVFNTDVNEATSFFSFLMLVFVVCFGVLPTLIIAKVKIEYGSWKRFSITSLATIGFLLIVAFANAGNWLWIDKHSTVLGALTMPWSYTVNACRYQSQKSHSNAQEILLPDATLKNDEKSVVVLVIGESARRENFSLYGYPKKTNPLLEKTQNLHAFKANSSATYTTAGVKNMLQHTDSYDLNEVLPNYLFRTGVEVFWRTSNWGEPPIHVENYERINQIAASCNSENPDLDETLLCGLREKILASEKNKILVVLHTSTSHGPQYSQKYSEQFAHFQPVCNSVELAKCSNEELINAYDNTIVYTDYLLHQTIEMLQQLADYQTAMLFVSDHGESLGEKNLYMHGVPMAVAPKEQYEIPFIVWTSENSHKTLKNNDLLTHFHVFHSVLNFLGVESPVYNENLNIFEE